jgi:restriction endonuclease
VPRRTNKFQRLVYLIQHQLSDDAVVTESRLLTDMETGRSVEVDVVVEGTMADVRFVVGMECKSGKRPATVEWVNEMATKHAALPVNKTILVSGSGFTAEAIAKADKRKIEAISLIDAEKRDWVEWICKLDALRFAGFALTIQQLSVTFEGTKPVSLEGLAHPDARIRLLGEERTHILKDYLLAVISQDKVILPVTRKWLQFDVTARPTSFEFQLTWHCRPWTTLEALSGEVHRLTSMVLLIRADVRDAPLLAKVSKFRDRNLLYAEVPNLLSDTDKSTGLITLFETDGALDHGAALFVEPDSSNSRVVKMKIVPPDNTAL